MGQSCNRRTYGIVVTLKKPVTMVLNYFWEKVEQHYSKLGNHFSNIDMGVTCMASLAP